MTNRLIEFCAQNSDKLANIDRQELIKIANEIDALKTIKDSRKKQADKQAIAKDIRSFRRITDNRSNPPGFYSDMNNLAALREAVKIAQEILSEA